MSYLEIFYNPSSNDWSAVSDKALEEIDYIPTVILCYPKEDNQENDEPKRSD